MKLLDKSGQHVGNDSEAIQAGRDVIIGNNTQDVIAICNLVVETKFAALQQKALQEVRNRANQFGTEIVQKLSLDIDEKIQEKLADPDIQFAISEATTIVARKGDKVKSDLLQEIIVSKIKNEDEEKDLLIDHAIEISKRLTTSEIKLLAFVYFFRSVFRTLNSEPVDIIIENYKNDVVSSSYSLDDCYQSYNKLYNPETSPLLNRIIGNLNNLSPVKKDLLAIKGCINNTHSYNKTYKELLSERTGNKMESEEDFDLHFPYIRDILGHFKIPTLDNFDEIVLNDLGKVIAENYINAQGGLN